MRAVILFLLLMVYPGFSTKTTRTCELISDFGYSIEGPLKFQHEIPAIIGNILEGYHLNGERIIQLWSEENDKNLINMDSVLSVGLSTSQLEHLYYSGCQNATIVRGSKREEANGGFVEVSTGSPAWIYEDRSYDGAYYADSSEEIKDHYCYVTISKALASKLNVGIGDKVYFSELLTADVGYLDQSVRVRAYGKQKMNRFCAVLPKKSPRILSRAMLSSNHYLANLPCSVMIGGIAEATTGKSELILSKNQIHWLGIKPPYDDVVMKSGKDNLEARMIEITIKTERQIRKLSHGTIKPRYSIANPFIADEMGASVIVSNDIAKKLGLKVGDYAIIVRYMSPQLRALKKDRDLLKQLGEIENAIDSSEVDEDEQLKRESHYPLNGETGILLQEREDRAVKRAKSNQKDNVPSSDNQIREKAHATNGNAANEGDVRKRYLTERDQEKKKAKEQVIAQMRKNGFL